MHNIQESSNSPTHVNLQPAHPFVSCAYSGAPWTKFMDSLGETKEFIHISCKYIYIQLYPQNVIEQYMSYQYVSRVLLFHLCEVCYNNYNIWKPWRNCCQPDGNVLPTIA